MLEKFVILECTGLFDKIRGDDVGLALLMYISPSETARVTISPRMWKIP